MSVRKERMTVTVDRALVEAAKEAVASGRAPSISTWVNAALAERVAREQRLRGMAEAIASYEAEFGEMSEAEMIVTTGLNGDHLHQDHRGPGAHPF